MKIWSIFLFLISNMCHTSLYTFAMVRKNINILPSSFLPSQKHLGQRCHVFLTCKWCALLLLGLNSSDGGYVCGCTLISPIRQGGVCVWMHTDLTHQTGGVCVWMHTDLTHQTGGGMCVDAHWSHPSDRGGYVCGCTLISPIRRGGVCVWMHTDLTHQTGGVCVWMHTDLTHQTGGGMCVDAHWSHRSDRGGMCVDAHWSHPSDRGGDVCGCTLISPIRPGGVCVWMHTDLTHQTGGGMCVDAHWSHPSDRGGYVCGCTLISPIRQGGGYVCGCTLISPIRQGGGMCVDAHWSHPSDRGGVCMWMHTDLTHQTGGGMCVDAHWSHPSDRGGMCVMNTTAQFDLGVAAARQVWILNATSKRPTARESLRNNAASQRRARLRDGEGPRAVAAKGPSASVANQIERGQRGPRLDTIQHGEGGPFTSGGGGGRKA